MAKLNSKSQRNRAHIRDCALVVLMLVTIGATSTGFEHRAYAAEPARPPDPAAATSRTQSATIHRVGPARDLKRPSDAAMVARDGDIVEIDGGDYGGDVAVWRQNRLTIRGVGGRARLRANGAHAEGKAIWVIKGNDTTIERIEFWDAKVPDHNGAGIRQEGAGLTVRDCRFLHNENGILSGANAASDIVIEHSEFAYNGAGDGKTHNIYIGHVRMLRLRFNYVHHAQVGHDVKSRATRNFIAYNRIMDELDGRSSYSIDLPNGGLSFVIGNVIQQGPRTENYTVISYGAEGLQHPVNELYVVNNTVINDRPAGARFVDVKQGTKTARVVNNVFVGYGETVAGPVQARDNVTATPSDFVDAPQYDYRLKAGSPAIGRGVDPGSVHGIPLRPSAEYVHPAHRRERLPSPTIDAGAFQFTG